jgi:hypothetical protein
MYKTILEKCLAELAKDKPELAYIRGMLETLIEIQTAPVTAILPLQPYKTQGDKELTSMPIDPYTLTSDTKMFSATNG